jgi:NTE family protein
MPVTAFSREDTLLWLQHLDVFTDVPEAELAILLTGMTWLELRSGEVLDADGAGLDDDHVFIVRYGSLGSTLLGMHRASVDMVPIGPGELLGEISVIAQTARPTTVVALRHSGLLRVEGRAFRAFIEASHCGSMQVTRYLAQRLMQNLKPRVQAVRPSSIALVAVAEGIDLIGIGRALVADAGAHRLAAELLSNIDLGLTAAEISASQMLNDLTIMVTCGDDPQWNELCIANADRLLYVDRVGHAPLPEPALDRILGGRSRMQIDVATLCPDTGTPPPTPKRWTGRRDISMHLHVRQGRADDLAFLGRVVGSRAVGMVLAGGGARGFAHLGVIRALREAGIPIDLFGGTSMGAIIAAGAAFEWSDEELMERMRQVFVISNPVNDYTVPIISLTRGNKVATRLRHHFGDLAIENAWRPFFAVSTNLSTCQPHIHNSGPVWRALRATSALPGILPPMVENGDVLVDGAIMNNFPVDVMRNLRRGPVVGVDMQPDARFASEVGEFEMMSTLRLIRGRSAHPVNVFSVISRTATASSLTHGQYCRSLADLVIDPEVRHVGLLHWRNLVQTAEGAYLSTKAQIEAERLTYASLLERSETPGS